MKSLANFGVDLGVKAAMGVLGAVVGSKAEAALGPKSNPNTKTKKSEFRRTAEAAALRTALLGGSAALAALTSVGGVAVKKTSVWTDREKAPHSIYDPKMIPLLVVSLPTGAALVLAVGALLLAYDPKNTETLRNFFENSTKRLPGTHIDT